MASFAALLWLAAGSMVWADCVPPVSMKESLAAKPTAETLADLGIWFAKQQEYECATKAFAGSLEIEPRSAHVAFMFGLSLYSAGHLTDAVASLQQAESMNYPDNTLHLILGAAFDQLHQGADAETEWRAALDVDPESTEALDSLSQDLIADNNFDGTITLLENPVVSEQRTAVQSLNLGLAYARSGRLEEAAKTLRDGVNTSPDSITLANELAVALVLQGKADEATAVVEVALERHPEDVDAGLLCLRTLMTVDADKASQLAAKLLQHSPHQWEVLYLNGVLETKDGKLDQARAHLAESVALNPDYAMSRDVFGLVLAQLQDMRGAKEQLEKAIALGDTDPDVEGNLSKVMQSLAAAK